jgi:hypothetical protein
MAISTPLKDWSQTERYYNSDIGQDGSGEEAVKKMWEELLKQVCMFVFLC